MLRLVRIALQVVLLFVLLGVVIAFGASETGALEKVALLAIAAVLIYAALLLRRSSVFG